MADFLISYKCLIAPVIQSEGDQGNSASGMRLVTGCHTYKLACDKLMGRLRDLYGTYPEENASGASFGQYYLIEDSVVFTNLTI